MAEKRTVERFSLRLPARVSVYKRDRDDEVMEFLSSNISAGGAFFETKQDLPVGTEVKIVLLVPMKKIRRPGGKDACIKASGLIIRSEEKGFAVRFGEKYEISHLRAVKSPLFGQMILN